MNIARFFNKRIAALEDKLIEKDKKIECLEDQIFNGEKRNNFLLNENIKLLAKQKRRWNDI